LRLVNEKYSRGFGNEIIAFRNLFKVPKLPRWTGKAISWQTTAKFVVCTQFKFYHVIFLRYLM